MPKYFAAVKVTADAIDLATHKIIIRGCVKILTAAIAEVPSTPTIIKSALQSKIINTPSSAAGIAIFKYFLSSAVNAILLNRSHYH